MKRLAIVAALAVASIVSVVAIPGASAQVRRGSRIFIGDSSTTISLAGNVEPQRPYFPTDTTLGMVVDGGMSVVGTVAVNGATALKVNRTTCTLNAASPSTCNGAIAMPAGSTCTCSLQGATAAIAAKGCAVGLSGTTVTAVSANAAAEVVNFTCL